MKQIYTHIYTDEQVKQMLDEGWPQNLATAGLAASLALGSPQKVEAKPTSSIMQMKNNIVAKVLAGEAAGEGALGMRAVACVIQNRAKGKDPVSVVTKPKQFSAYDDPGLMARNYSQVKEIADKIASEIGTLQDITGGATHYVTTSLYARKKDDPRSWISRMQVTKIIGAHIFMKEKQV